MTTSAISDQACPSECSDLPDMESAAKRARIEVKPFQDLDLNQFVLKNNGKGKNGPIVYPLIAGEPIRFNLTINDWLQTPFGFDLETKFEKPSFLGGKDPEKPGTPEGLNLRLNLQPAQAEFLSKLDNAARKAFADITTANWNPLVNANAILRLSSCKVAVILKGDGLTKLAIVQNSKVERGEGWEFLQGYNSNFKRAEVKLTVRVKKLWNVAGKAGLSLEATQLVLRPTEKPTEQDAFGDDQELLA